MTSLALLTGAGGVLGERLAEGLRGLGFEVVPAGRRARTGEWLAWDMRGEPPGFDRRFDCVVHAAPLWLLPPHIQRLAENGASRILCYSSTSALTKRGSASPSDRRLAGMLASAEVALGEQSGGLGLATTIFRPTMIYGYGRDDNITAIARFIGRFGFFPVAGHARGKRQPIHVDDAAQAAVSALGSSASHGRTYVLGGGETLAYRAMVARIFEAMGRPSRILRVPLALYRAVLGVAGLLGASVTPSMADRMNLDMVFDDRQARDDLAFAPQGFLEHPGRDLPAA